MKKVFLLLLVIALSVATLSAQVKPTSIEYYATYSLFNNALDAAATIDESVTDLDFSTLGKDYLFTGIAGNLQKFTNFGGSSANLMLGYYKAAEKPWSIFTNFNWTSADLQSGEVDNGVDEETKYNYKLFDVLHPKASFLINLGSFSTGLGLDVELTDKKNHANNYKRTNSTTNTTTERKNKNFETDIKLFVPFFTQTNNLSHYAELKVDMNFVDTGSSNYVSNNVTTPEDDKTIALLTTISPSILYKLSMPTEKLGTFYGSGKIGLEMLSNKNEYVDNVGDEKSSTKNKYAPGFDATLTAGLRMEQSTDGDWLRFRLNPEAEYYLSTNSYAKGYTTSSTMGNNPTVTTTYIDGKALTLENSLALSLRTAMEIKPEKWIVGLMLGGYGTISYSNTTTTLVTAKDKEQEDNNSTIKRVRNSWGTSGNSRFGIFIPLPNDYRFDISIDSTATNLLEPGSLKMQLIVPLGKTTGF